MRNSIPALAVFSALTLVPALALAGTVDHPDNGTISPYDNQVQNSDTPLASNHLSISNWTTDWSFQGQAQGWTSSVGVCTPEVSFTLTNLANSDLGGGTITVQFLDDYSKTVYGTGVQFFSSIAAGFGQTFQINANKGQVLYGNGADAGGCPLLVGMEARVTIMTMDGAMQNVMIGDSMVAQVDNLSHETGN